MDRRAVITVISGSILVVGWLLATPLAGEAQKPDKVPRIGYLIVNPLANPPSAEHAAFIDGLRGLGYVVGQNLIIEYRSAEGKPERIPELAAELVRRKVDVIVAWTGTVAIAAKNATQTIPIVMVHSGDAVRQGLVASLTRPGGNVTGLTMISPELSRKRLEVLREMLPKVSRVGVLWCGGGPVADQEWTETQIAAAALGIRLSSLKAQGQREELVRAFESAVKLQAQAVLGFDCALFAPSAALIAELSLKHRLPGIYPFSLYPAAGSLLSYGARLVDPPRRAAVYVDKILKGSQPGDLPVEQPTKFELIINLKTAKSLGLTIPQSLLVRADQVIE
jgi:putative ABC transport system substrate-binding protein